MKKNVKNMMSKTRKIITSFISWDWKAFGLSLLFRYNDVYEIYWFSIEIQITFLYINIDLIQKQRTLGDLAKLFNKRNHEERSN